MTGLVICAPLRLEAVALRRGGVGTETVYRSGAGRRRAVRAAQSGRVRSATAIAVAGIAGGLRPDLAEGTVVVASEVWTSTGNRVRLSTAPELAGCLEQAGLRPCIGPLISTDRVVAGRQRERLTETGALGVDMESGWLLSAGGLAPAGVVRVIADVFPARLLSPATLTRVVTALRVLPRLTPALLDWGAAMGGTTGSGAVPPATGDEEQTFPQEEVRDI